MALLRPILYRHWLEIRGTIVLTAVVLGVASVIDIAILTLATGDAGLWHGWLTGAVGMVAAVVLGGTGVRTNDLMPDHPSQMYTLTLPVERSRWVLTRFGLGMAAAAATILVMFSIVAVLTELYGAPTTLGDLARTTVLLGLATLAVQALIGMLKVWSDNVAAFSVPILLAVFIVTAMSDGGEGPRILAPLYWLIENPPDLPTALVSAVLVIAGATWMATVLARTREF